MPLGREDGFYGVVDLVAMKAVVWDEETLGASYRSIDIPADAASAAAALPGGPPGKALPFDDRFMECYLEGEAIDEALIRETVRNATCGLACVPVLCGSALRNKGIQPLLDAIIATCPRPSTCPPWKGSTRRPARRSTGRRARDEDLAPSPSRSSWKRDAKLVYIRIYSGTLSVGEDILNVNLGKKEKVSRIYKIHAAHKDRVAEAHVGDIVGIVGLKETSTGHTLVRTRPSCSNPSACTSPSSRWRSSRGATPIRRRSTRCSSASPRRTPRSS